MGVFLFDGTTGDFFLDGPGYKVAMNAWLPFLEGAAQFAFYFVIMEHRAQHCGLDIEMCFEDTACRIKINGK
jgi:hypothetical protein